MLSECSSILCADLLGWVLEHTHWSALYGSVELRCDYTTKAEFLKNMLHKLCLEIGTGDHMLVK